MGRVSSFPELDCLSCRSVLTDLSCAGPHEDRQEILKGPYRTLLSSIDTRRESILHQLPSVSRQRTDSPKFETNKRIVDEIAIIASKRLRNKVYLISLCKPITFEETY